MTAKSFLDADSYGFVLDSRTYQESDLPSLEDAKVSNVVKAVVEMLLSPNPTKVSCDRIFFAFIITRMLLVLTLKV